MTRITDEQITQFVKTCHFGTLLFYLGACCAHARRHPERSFFDIWRDVLEDAKQTL